METINDMCAEIYPSRMSFSTWLLDLAQEGGAK